MNAPASAQLLRPAELRAGARDWTSRWDGEDIWATLCAAHDGDARTLKRLLDQDPSLVAAEYWYTPPLHFAVREGHIDAVRLLLERGASVFGLSYYSQETLLQTALDRGHHAVADCLREQLQRIAASSGAKHAIHDAAAGGDLDVVEGLLSESPNLANRGDALGRRPLHYAVESGEAGDAGKAEMIDLLVRHGADVDALGFSSDDRLGGTGFRPIASALWQHPYWEQRNDYAVASGLLAHGAAYTTAIAAALGDEQRVRELLRENAAFANDPEPSGKRPISAAAERNRLAIVDLLLQHGADPNLPEGPNCPRGHALWAASHFGHVEIAKLLLAAGADPNAEMESSGTPTGAAKDASMRALMLRHGGRVPLSQHFFKGNIDVVAALLDAAPALFDEQRAVEGFTLGLTAGHEDMLRLMLARGLRVPPVVTICQTYLWRDLALARLLLEHGMDANLPNWQSVRPLHHMASKGQVEAARLFLEFGADSAAVDEEYRSTPLGWAARAGQTAFVRFALANGFPAAAGGPPWAHAAAWAARRDHDDIVALLASESG